MSHGTGGGWRGALHEAARAWWEGEGGVAGSALRVAAAPAEALFRGAVALRNRRWDAGGGTRVAGMAVVSVGNLAVGGTGKTPLAAWLARHLAGRGYRCAVLTRDADGDETLLHRRWNPEVPVVGDRHRVAGTRAAAALGCRVVVMDDGFQHRQLARDLDVVLLAAEDPFPGRLLPRGPFREPAGALARAHVAVVTRRAASEGEAEALERHLAAAHPHLAVGRVALQPGAWADLDGVPAPPPEGPLLAVAGIARPRAFARQLEAMTGKTARLMAYPDHHAYTRHDVGAMRVAAGNGTVVVTEKDAVKLHAFRRDLEPVRVLAQTVVWEKGEDTVTRLLTAAAGRGA